MIGNRNEMSFYQSIFYRDNYYRILNWFYIFFQPATHYYITTTSGQIMLLPKGS
jgi:hypothetical protein